MELFILYIYSLFWKRGCRIWVPEKSCRCCMLVWLISNKNRDIKAYMRFPDWQHLIGSWLCSYISFLGKLNVFLCDSLGKDTRKHNLFSPGLAPHIISFADFNLYPFTVINLIMNIMLFPCPGSLSSKSESLRVVMGTLSHDFNVLIIIILYFLSDNSNMCAISESSSDDCVIFSHYVFLPFCMPYDILLRAVHVILGIRK